MAVSTFGAGSCPGLPVTKATHGQTPAHVAWERLKLPAQVTQTAQGTRFIQSPFQITACVDLQTAAFPLTPPLLPILAPPPPPHPGPVPTSPSPTLLVCKDPQVTKEELEMAFPKVTSV